MTYLQLGPGEVLVVGGIIDTLAAGESSFLGAGLTLWIRRLTSLVLG